MSLTMTMGMGMGMSMTMTMGRSRSRNRKFQKWAAPAPLLKSDSMIKRFATANMCTGICFQQTDQWPYTSPYPNTQLELLNSARTWTRTGRSGRRRTSPCCGEPRSGRGCPLPTWRRPSWSRSMGTPSYSYAATPVAARQPRSPLLSRGFFCVWQFLFACVFFGLFLGSG